MKYKVTISNNGQWSTAVIDPGKHVCNDIVATVGSFGEVRKVSDKRDDVPVRDNVHVGGSNV
jgi:hypothetical protein